ncbi:hypothetical protein [Arthrobacter rhombi]|uniref:hypothetical protein n=1 Tax=Arthrobacter rhombi TaxID=71253 RepID=UPI003FD54636
MRSKLLAILIPVLALTMVSCVASHKGAAPTVTVTATVTTPARHAAISETMKRETDAFKRCSFNDDGISMDNTREAGECSAISAIRIDHPDYGDTDFSVGLEASDEGDFHIRYWLVNLDGNVVKTKRSKEFGHVFSIGDLRNDGSGNIIYSYNPGRTDGCVALRPDGGWFQGFGTDPLEVGKGKLPYQTRFYDAIWTDPDGDDTYEILQNQYEDPEGDYPPTVYEWDSSDYVPAEVPVPDL